MPLKGSVYSISIEDIKSLSTKDVDGNLVPLTKLLIRKMKLQFQFIQKSHLSLIHFYLKV